MHPSTDALERFARATRTRLRMSSNRTRRGDSWISPNRKLSLRKRNGPAGTDGLTEVPAINRGDA